MGGVIAIVFLVVPFSLIKLVVVVVVVVFVVVVDRALRVRRRRFRI